MNREEEKVYAPIKLTKKNLLTFLNEYEKSLHKPMEGTEEEREAGFLSEWLALNEELKKAGRKKSYRKNKKSMLKDKWGLRVGYKTRITQARLSLIGSIKKTFSL